MSTLATRLPPPVKTISETPNGTVHSNSFPLPVREDAPDDGRYVSEAVYWRDYYSLSDVSYEWNNGILEAKPLSTKRQLQLYQWFLVLLMRYLTVYPNADLVYLETGFTMMFPDPKKPGKMKRTVRKPDIAIVRHDNPVVWGDDEHSYAGIFDLCVESVSDSTKLAVERDTKTKKSEYLLAGVQEYYILDPKQANMHFYRRLSTGTYSEIVPNAEGIIQSEVLPGFQFRLTDLALQPDLTVLAFDEVYRGYILPEFQAATERAEQEELRAEEEKQRAEQERLRAEEERLRAEEEKQRAEQERLRADQADALAQHYAAILRQLGINPNEIGARPA